MQNYKQQQMTFLDELTPQDIRNGESFNDMENILDKINEAVHQRILTGKDHKDLLNKSFTNLFREGSSAIAKAIALSEIYLKTR